MRAIDFDSPNNEQTRTANGRAGGYTGRFGEAPVNLIVAQFRDAFNVVRIEKS